MYFVHSSTGMEMEEIFREFFEVRAEAREENERQRAREIV